MIYIDIFHDKPEDEEYQGVRKVIIVYSPKDPIKGGNLNVIMPHNGHLIVEFGFYSKKQGFFNSMIQIKGIIENTNHRVTKILPLPSCIITEHYT